MSISALRSEREPPIALHSCKKTITGSTPLPIWHDISYEEVYEFSPTLAGVFAYSTTDYSIDDICQALKLTLEKVPV